MTWPGRGARSIRHRLVGIVLATTFAALTLAGIALMIFDLKSYESSMSADLLTQADIMGTASAPALAFEDEKVARENLSLLKASPAISAAAIYTAKGGLFAEFVRDGLEDRQFPQLPQSEAVSSDGRFVTVWRRIISNGEVLGTVYLQARDESRQRVQYYLGVLGLIMIASLLTALLLTNRLQMSLTEPIVAISNVARRVMESRDFSLRATRTTDDEVGVLVDAFNDMLTELGRRAEVLEASNQALHASDERYQLAVRGSSAGLWDWNILSNDVFLSPRFKHLLGYGEEELPSSFASFFSALHPDDRLPARRGLDAHFSRRRTPFQIELRLRTRDGEYRWFYMGGEAVADASGKPYRMAGSIIDITERKVAEDAAAGGRPAQGRVPRHARARAAQPAGADPHRRCSPDAGRRRRRQRGAGARRSSSASSRTWCGWSTTCSTSRASPAARSQLEASARRRCATRRRQRGGDQPPAASSAPATRSTVAPAAQPIAVDGRPDPAGAGR